MPDLIQLTLGLLTIAASGITSAIVTFKLANKRELLMVRRSKLELINQSLIGWCDQLGVHWITFQSVMVGKIDYNQALDIQNSRTDQPHHAKQLQVLIPLYFPELKSHFDVITKVMDKGAGILNDYRTLYEETGGDNSHAHSSLIVELSKELDAAESNFQLKISAIAKSLNN